MKRLSMAVTLLLPSAMAATLAAENPLPLQLMDSTCRQMESGPFTIVSFEEALQSHLASERNQSGVTSLCATNLANAGEGSLTMKLATSGALPAGVSIYGVSLRLTLPPRATIGDSV